MTEWMMAHPWMTFFLLGLTLLVIDSVIENICKAVGRRSGRRVRMAKSGKGGMQASSLHYSIYCPKCGKPAARAEETVGGMRYLHFTRKGSVWHEVKSATSTTQDTTTL